MREIKFRGRKICKNEWVYGYYIEDGLNNHYIVEIKDKKDKDYYYGETYRYVEVIPETIGQFTGLYDKTENPIYEGDIVNIEYKETTVENAVIEYRGSSFYGATLSDMWELDMYSSIEVIGNIYDKETN